MPELWPISPVSCSAVPDDSSEAVIDWSRPVTLPVATDGVPPLPPALPSATTFSLLCTPDELRLTVCRLAAGCRAGGRAARCLPAHRVQHGVRHLAASSSSTSTPGIVF